MSSERDSTQKDPQPNTSLIVEVQEQRDVATPESSSEANIEVENLFDEIYLHFQELPKEDFELFIPPSTNPAEIRLLFEEVQRNLKPKKNTSFENKKIITSNERKLESGVLAEKALHTAKIIKIKETERQKEISKEQARRKRMLEDQQIVVPPALIDRLGVMLIDTTFILVATITLSIPLNLLLYPLHIFALLSGSPLPNSILLLMGVVLGLLPLVIISYHLFWTIQSGRTPGYRFSRLLLVDNYNNRPHPSSLLARGAIMPFSLLFFGFITPIVGLKSLADLISGTRVIQEYTSIEEE